ncbi:MAG: hypothetical protein LBK99_12065 [Opitutaceae bacterium]|jgi:ABC-2 type transport system permease protein|nr:hypothetical protein [Opitutaceae bacterium]
MRKARHEIRFAFLLIRNELRQSRRSLMEALIIAFRCGLLLLVYASTYRMKGDLIAGLRYETVAWSMFLYFMFSTLKLRRIAPSLFQDIQSGDVQLLINRPIPHLGYRMWNQIAAGCVSAVCVVPVAVFLMFLNIPAPSIMRSGIFWGTLPVVLAGCVILSLLVYSIIGLAAFWMEEPTPLFWISDKSVMILGGSLLPVAFFPPFMKTLAIYSPFGSCQLLTHMTSATWNHEALKSIGIQWFWIVTLLFFLVWLNKKARVKLSINGG